MFPRPTSLVFANFSLAVRHEALESRVRSGVGVWTPCRYVHRLLYLLLPHLSTPPPRLTPARLPRPQCGAFISPPPYLCAQASAPLCPPTWPSSRPSCNRASCNRSIRDFSFLGGGVDEKFGLAWAGPRVSFFILACHWLAEVARVERSLGPRVDVVDGRFMG